MRKSTTLILAMVLVCFAIMAVNADRALGQTEHETMIWRLKQIVLMLKGQVLPRLGSVPKTGQTTSHELGDDGDLQMGAAWPNPRFTDNGDGTVSDNLTGLIWLKNADCFGLRNWTDGCSGCNNLADPACGLSDSSTAGEWRLPNIRELHSLIDFGNWNPALPNGHPFDNVHTSYYWSSTTDAGNTASAWFVYFPSGYVGNNDKSINCYVWCVRGGN